MSRSEPIAYLLTWTTYGSWLPGDARGWVSRTQPGVQAPDASREHHARIFLSASDVVLDEEQRRIVETTIRRHCEIRNWALHAVSVQSTHIHVVVSADIAPEKAMEQFKAWCSRRLSEAEPVGSTSAVQPKWWTRHGSTKWIKDEVYLHNAIRYVLEGQ